MKYNKTNPYTVFEYIFKYAFIFILPILQQIIFYYYDIFNVLNSLSLNIAFILLFILFCICEYKTIEYCHTENIFTKRNGILIKKNIFISYNNIHLLTIKEAIFPSLFGVSTLKLDIPSKKSKKADISLNLSKKALIKAVNSILPKYNIKNIYKASNLSIFLMAFSWSNSATGLLLTAPFIKKAGTILGKEFEQKLYSTFDFSLYLVTIGIPPLTAILTYILILGFIVSLIVQFFRYSKFTVKKSQQNIIISRGALSTNKTMINIKNINAIFIKQTILMRIFKLYSAYINTISSKKEKEDHSMLFAAASYEKLEKSICELFNISVSQKLEIRPPKKAMKSFVMLPSIFLLTVITLFLYVKATIYYGELLNLIFLFLIAVLLWWLVIKVLAYKTSGILIYNKSIIINGYKHLSIISGIVSYSKIQFISLSQNIFQRISGLSNMKVYIYSEKSEYFTVKNLKHSSAKTLIKNISLL